MRDCDAAGASGQPSRIRVLSRLDPQGSLHKGQGPRTIAAPGSVRRVADSWGTCGVVEHPAGFGRSATLVYTGTDPSLRLCGCACGGRTGLVYILLAMAAATSEYCVSVKSY